MTKHEFGGVWTQLKLDVFRDYVNFFTTALKNRNFNLHYADAFAGTGQQNLKLSKGRIFSSQERILRDRCVLH